MWLNLITKKISQTEVESNNIKYNYLQTKKRNSGKFRQRGKC